MSPFRTRTRSQLSLGDTMPLFLRLILGLVAIVAVFYLAWLGTTFARNSLPASAVTTSASAQTISTPTASTSTNTPVAAAVAAPLASNAAFFNTGSTITLGGSTLNVAVATTTAEIDQGLQNQPSLTSSEGELFVFNKASIYRFWMPNMNFPLDMVWIGSNKQIVDITKDAPILLDPSNPVWFTPKTPAQYVLEVPAGYADEHDLQDGDTVSFSIAPSL